MKKTIILIVIIIAIAMNLTACGCNDKSSSGEITVHDETDISNETKEELDGTSEEIEVLVPDGEIEEMTPQDGTAIDIEDSQGGSF